MFGLGLKSTSKLN